MRRLISAAFCLAAPAAAVAALTAAAPTASAQVAQVTVDMRDTALRASFAPQTVFGAAVDGVPAPAVPEIYTPANVAAMLGAGFGPVSYRLYTELSVQDWHWNVAGSFSAPGGAQGYWTSIAAPGAPLADTYGYRLPRRGFTHDQGNDDDYSRLDDGRADTFWKSNPYLAAAYTGDPDSAHAQWVLVDLGSPRAVNAARIAWAAPYAVQYAVQYWTGDDPIYDPAHGAWVSFPQGTVSAGAGGTVTLALGRAPASVEYIRLVMTRSSGSCAAPGGADARDCLGYAIAELGLGTLDAAGNFTDFMVHRPDNSQTVTYASSVDPWHTAQNRVHGQEQPGFDIVFRSGLTRGLPATVPVPMLYSTPENAAAEISYLRAQGYAIARVEMGEEPDGQYVTPEDYAALYVQFAVALHAVDPALQLGGPVFEDNPGDVPAWPDAAGETSWTKRFLAYLRAHGHIGDFNFFSFEHYPFAACGSAKTQADLLREPGVLTHILNAWKNDGLPAGTPIFITETNYSQNETDAAQYPAGAIWYADMMGTLLSQGGAGAFFYEYEPIPLSRAYPCPGWGSYGVLRGDARYRAGQKLAQYWAARVLTTEWTQPGAAPHRLYAAHIAGGADWITAYPVLRPDGRWAVLLVNRDLAAAHQVTLGFTGGGATAFGGTVRQVSFGAAQYAWVADGAASHAAPDHGPVASAQPGGAGAIYTLPQASVTVLSGVAGAP